jgi:hypothetical protein
VWFIPSHDRFEEPIADQDFWVTAALRILGETLGGATAFPQGRGVWRDDDQGGRLVFDAPVIVQSYTSEQKLEEHVGRLRSFLISLGEETRQGAVAFVIDRTLLEIKFPLK